MWVREAFTDEVMFTSLQARRKVGHALFLGLYQFWVHGNGSVNILLDNQYVTSNLQIGNSLGYKQKMVFIFHLDIYSNYIPPRPTSPYLIITFPVS